MTHFTYKDYYKDPSGKDSEDHYKEEQLVIFALVSKEIIIHKIKQSGQKNIFMPVANHRIDDMPLLMDVSQHKVKKNLIICLATSSKELDHKTQNPVFSTIVLEFIKIKETDEYRVETIFE